MLHAILLQTLLQKDELTCFRTEEIQKRTWAHAVVTNSLMFTEHATKNSISRSSLQVHS